MGTDTTLILAEAMDTKKRTKKEAKSNALFFNVDER